MEATAQNVRRYPELFDAETIASFGGEVDDDSTDVLVDDTTVDESSSTTVVSE